MYNSIQVKLGGAVSFAQAMVGWYVLYNKAFDVDVLSLLRQNLLFFVSFQVSAMKVWR